MPRFMPPSDFRARRRVLLKSDFALACGPEQLLSDKIDKATWNHIVTLPDDVAVRTTNHLGSPEQDFRYCTLDAAFREWELLFSSAPKIRPDLTAGGPT